MSAIYTFLEMQYDDVGSDVVIITEEYAHYWGQSVQPSYQATCILIYMTGSDTDFPCPDLANLEKCNVIIIGNHVVEEEMTEFAEGANLSLQDENGS